MSGSSIDSSKDLEEIGTVEVASKLDGRNMTMMFAPVKKKPKPVKAEKATEGKKAGSDAKDEDESRRGEAFPAHGNREDHAPHGVGVAPVQVEDQAATDPAEEATRSSSDRTTIGVERMLGGS